MNKGVEAIPELIHKLYKIVGELEAHFPGRKFTPDGHLVGSIGEVLVAHKYELKLLPNSAEKHDAVDKDGSIEEIYFDKGDKAWNIAGKMQKNGQRRISLNGLKALS